MALSATAQRQNDNWYFGNTAAVQFSGTSVTSLSISPMYSTEGVATVSDHSSGALLFYTNGQQVWNATHQVMLHGSGLLTGVNTSASQGALIVPYPGDTTRYYLFTVDETYGTTTTKTMYYSIVDMQLDSGRGDVDSLQKNIPIINGATERLAVCPRADGTGYWIMTHLRGSTKFVAYTLTAAGLDPTSVESSVGLIHDVNSSGDDNTMGCLKFNYQGTRLAVALYQSKRVQVFDFDACTGIVSHPITITAIGETYGVEFSPDGSRLYYTLALQGAVFQVNLLAGSDAAIAASSRVVGVTQSLQQYYGSIQLAPNGVLYIAPAGEPYLSAIYNPDRLGLACTWVDTAVRLSRGTALYGLPQQVPDQPQRITAPLTNSILVSDTCINSTTLFQLRDTIGLTNPHWQFDDPLSGTDDSTSIISPTHSYTDAGTYTVSVSYQIGCTTDTLRRSIQISSPPAAPTLTDTTLCSDRADTLTLTAPLIPAVQYLWSTGSTLPTTTITTSGSYSLSVSNSCGTASAQLLVAPVACDTTAPCHFALPTAFTPNADSKNERFIIPSTCTPDTFHLRIYNRWGQLVYESYSSTDSWDGTYHDSPCPAGIYHLYIHIAYSGSPAQQRITHLQLLR
jgi:gliding motility-associated-like protein